MDTDMTKLFYNFLASQGIGTMQPKGYPYGTFGGDSLNTTPSLGLDAAYAPKPETPSPTRNTPYKSEIDPVSGTPITNPMSRVGAQTANTLSTMINAYISNQAHNKYADTLMSQTMETPKSIETARSGYEDLATQGLIGYDTMRSGLFNSLAEITNKASETGEPSSVLKTLADSYSKVEETLNGLQITNADAKMKNQLALLTFMSQVQSPYEQRINEFNISKKLAAEQEKMQGTADILTGVGEGAALGASIGSLFHGFGTVIGGAVGAIGGGIYGALS